jgi:N-carbamoylputrescine amidase
VSVNRTGFEPSADGGLEFWGQSFVANPYGEVLARAATEQEETLVVRCDLSLIGEARVYWPFLRDRRIDAYGELTQRYID